MTITNTKNIFEYDLLTLDAWIDRLERDAKAIDEELTLLRQLRKLKAGENVSVRPVKSNSTTPKKRGRPAKAKHEIRLPVKPVTADTKRIILPKTRVGKGGFRQDNSLVVELIRKAGRGLKTQEVITMYAEEIGESYDAVRHFVDNVITRKCQAGELERIKPEGQRTGGLVYWRAEAKHYGENRREDLVAILRDASEPLTTVQIRAEYAKRVGRPEKEIEAFVESTVHTLVRKGYFIKGGGVRERTFVLTPLGMVS